MSAIKIQRYDWAMVAGDTYTFPVIVKDDSVPAAVVDITGYTGHLVIIKDGITLIDKITSDPTQGSITGSSGQAYFLLEAADTTVLNEPVYNLPYEYEVQITSSMSKPYTTHRGHVIFLKPIVTAVP